MCVQSTAAAGRTRSRCGFSSAGNEGTDPAWCMQPCGLGAVAAAVCACAIGDEDTVAACDVDGEASVVRGAVTIAIVPPAATAVSVAARASLCMVGPFLSGEASTCEAGSVPPMIATTEAAR